MQKITFLSRISLGRRHHCCRKSTNFHCNLFLKEVKRLDRSTKGTLDIQTFSYLGKESKKWNKLRHFPVGANITETGKISDNKSQVSFKSNEAMSHILYFAGYISADAVERKQKVSSNISAPPSPRQPTDIAPVFARHCF